MSPIGTSWAVGCGSLMRCGALSDLRAAARSLGPQAPLAGCHLTGKHEGFLSKA